MRMTKEVIATIGSSNGSGRLKDRMRMTSVVLRARVTYLVHQFKRLPQLHLEDASCW